ncbi:hypothetical protein LCGC14_2304920, partial [marine sediment metagenome]
ADTADMTHRGAIAGLRVLHGPFTGSPGRRFSALAYVGLSTFPHLRGSTTTGIVYQAGSDDPDAAGKRGGVIRGGGTILAVRTRIHTEY